MAEKKKGESPKLTRKEQREVDKVETWLLEMTAKGDAESATTQFALEQLQRRKDKGTL